jgi:hypothetical protein
MEKVIGQHETIWTDDGIVLECLYTGNISEMDARSFFDKAAGIIKTRSSSPMNGSDTAAKSNSGWVPGESVSALLFALRVLLMQFYVSFRPF